MINKRSINCFLLLQRRLCWLYTTKIMARKSKQFNWHIDYIIDRFVHFVSFFKYLKNIFFKTQVTWFCFIKTWFATNLLYNFITIYRTNYYHKSSRQSSAKLSSKNKHVENKQSYARFRSFARIVENFRTKDRVFFFFTEENPIGREEKGWSIPTY